MFQAAVQKEPCYKKTVCLMDSDKNVKVKIHVLQAIHIQNIGLVRSHTVDNCEQLSSMQLQALS